MDTVDTPEIKRPEMEESIETQTQHQTAIGPVGPCPYLPEEILEKIFLNLDDGKDLKALSDTSSQFNRILEPSKTEWAFSQVFPLIFGELDKEDILNCRLVCKQWNKTVDEFLPTLPTDRYSEPYPHQSDHILNRNHPPHAPQFQPSRAVMGMTFTIFRDAGAIRRLLEEMRSHPRNPLVFRDVRFESIVGDDEEYWNEGLTFLRVFGQQIWHVSLNPNLDPDRRIHLCRNYRILGDALSLMPNLKTLFLHGFDTDPLGYDANRRLLICMTKYIGRRPLPELPHLHTLQIFLPRQPNPVMDELMRRYSSQLKHFAAPTSVWMKTGRNFNELPQVTYLHLNFNASLSTWSKFCGSVEASNLAKLSLIIWKDWRISKLLKPLMKSFPSLVYLRLKFRKKSQDFESNDPAEFLLEKIKTLEIEDTSNAPYDQLIKYLPCLEYVLVCQHAIQDAEEDEEEESEESDEESEEVEEMSEIRKLILSGAIYQSDIWTRLNFLKEFTLAMMGTTGETEYEIYDKVQYTREVYNYKSGQGN